MLMATIAAAVAAGCGNERTGLSSFDAESNAASPEILISGELTYRARIALPDDSVAVVELRRTDVDDVDSLVAEQRIELAGRQVPIAFTISAPSEAAGTATRLRLQGSVFAAGRPAWSSGAVDVDISTATEINIGSVLLTPFQPMGFSSELDCGGERLSIGFIGDMMRLKAGTELFDLKPAPAASGARYEVEGDPTISVWNKGGEAIITLRGVTLPKCVVAAPAGARDGDASGEASPPTPKPYIARGNEPFWMLQIKDGRIEITPNIGEPVLSAKLPEPETADSESEKATDAAPETPATASPSQSKRVYAMRIKRQPVRVRIENRPCQDTMSGQYYPDVVSVMIGENELNGCGGESSALLIGAEWVIEDVAGRGIVDASRGTLNFTEEGRVFGLAFCNAFNSAYELTGEGLKFGLAASTMKACAPALMDLERRFFDVLAKVSSFEIDETGALILRGEPGATILARRTKPEQG